MRSQIFKIDELVDTETKRVKKKRPFLEAVEVMYEQNGRGAFLSKVRAKTKNKTIVLTEENRCLEAAIRKVFINLTRLLTKKKYRKNYKLQFMEVA